MKETYKNIPGWNGLHQVSNLGNVISLNGGRKLLSRIKRKNGYTRITLTYKGKVKSFLIHRLVMLAFCGYSKLPVNHKNGIRNDNRLENLEYCTSSENRKHSIHILGNKTSFQINNPGKGKFGGEHNRSKKVNQYSLDGKFIKTWNSIIEVTRKLGIHSSGISQCCKGNISQSGQYIWQSSEMV